MGDGPKINTAANDAPRNGTQSLSLLDLLIKIAEQKGVTLRIVLATTLLTALVVYILPNQYTAETVLLPPGQNSSAGSALLNQLGSGALASMASGSLGIKNPTDMYVSLMRGRSVEDAVIDRFGLMSHYKAKKHDEARRILEKRVSITAGKKDGLIRIDVTDTDQKLVSEIANGYVEEFRRLSANLAITEASQRRLFFQQQMEEAKNNLTNAEIALKNTEQTTGVFQIDNEARISIESAANLRAQIVARQVQLQGLLSFATDDNIEVIQAKQQLAALQKQLAKMVGDNPAANTDPVIPTGKIPEAGLEYVRRYRDVKYYETIFELIAKQFEMAKIDEAREGVMIQVAEPAVPPESKSFPHRILMIAAAAVFGFILAVVWILLRETMRQVLDDDLTHSKLMQLSELLRMKRR